uniref:Uncharacterized protein n=1 Tax=Rhizophora mucronata TaxID=61149 RepID=A0A2P2QR93_RHIMU
MQSSKLNKIHLSFECPSNINESRLRLFANQRKKSNLPLWSLT